MKNLEYAQKGISLLHPSLAKFIGKEFKRVYKRGWPGAIREALSDQERTLLEYSDKELLKSLDFLCCLRLIDRRWREVFSSPLSRECRSSAIELMGFRNQVAHIGSGDLDRETVRKALESMALLGSAIDRKTGKELDKLCRKCARPSGILGFFRRC